MIVFVASFDSLDWDSPEAPAVKVGRWVSELICSVPIQIAKVFEDRFVPLGNNMFSMGRVLQAETASIIDAIALGPYEPVFAYHSGKPVRVVSSMGERRPY